MQRSCFGRRLFALALAVATAKIQKEVLNMRYSKLTPREKEIYRRAKIAAYYKLKSEQKKKQEKQTKTRYGSFDPKEAFNRALERSYGDKFKTR